MSSEFPFLGTTEPVQSNSLPLFKIWAWDFDKDNFIYDGNGKRILLTGNDALKVWIYKVLRTERYVWLAYSRRYGIELYPFINKVMAVGERKAEMRRMIIEALMVNPYIKSIDSVTFTETNHAENLSVDVELTTVYGKLTV
ncbi:MAG: DUF2634 domain-containing protein [Selenomonadaceae bacterium]|nr:DUF2634 domain-containing protein [Selenomonadaceae bacterium]